MSENEPSPTKEHEDSEVELTDPGIGGEEPTVAANDPTSEASEAEAVPEEDGDESAEAPGVEGDGKEGEVLEGLFLSPEDSESEVIEASEPQSPANAARIGELEAIVKSLEEERDDFKNRMVRVAADFENFRKRANREKQELRKFGIDRVVLELLPVIDNLERALLHTTEADNAGGVVDGVRMVYKQFVSALKKHGVEGFDSVGEMFDPQKHEAIQQVESEEHDTNTVMEQFQKGYFLHERLIRPALVSVAKKVESTDTSKDDDTAPESVSTEEDGSVILERIDDAEADEDTGDDNE